MAALVVGTLNPMCARNRILVGPQWGRSREPGVSTEKYAEPVRG